jgi:hypothetical protein
MTISSRSGSTALLPELAHRSGHHTVNQAAANSSTAGGAWTAVNDPGNQRTMRLLADGSVVLRSLTTASLGNAPDTDAPERRMRQQGWHSWDRKGRRG